MKLKRAVPAGVCNRAPPDSSKPPGALGAGGRRVCGVTWLGATACERAANG
jgi:hypothetical protein